jgi:hypothetical protein
VQRTLHAAEEQLTAELRRLDREWMEAAADRTVALAQLEELYRLFSYHSRWSSQVHERIVQLSF